MTSNSFQVEYTPQAIKQLSKLDKHTQRLLYAWIEKNLKGCENPRNHGKALVANHQGKWRYRIGNYRIIADIQEDKLIVLVLQVGHRRLIYNVNNNIK